MWPVQNINSKGAGSGAAAPSAPNVTFIRDTDVLNPEMPRDSKGVLIVGDIIPKQGAKMFTIYLTPSKQVKNYTSEGDEDMETVKQKFEGWHPGDDIDINEFVQNNLGVGFFIIADNCVDQYKRVYGTKCSPMKLNVEQTSDNSGRGIKLVFEQKTGTKYVPAFYNGNMVFSEPTATDETIDLTIANGNQFKISADEAGASISIATTDQVTGAVVSFIGSGGGDPSTLDNGASTAATFILKDGTTWTALENATITFEVIDDGTDVYLIERARS